MKSISFIYILGLVFIFASCVDDFEDANPPRLLDAPAVNSLSITEDVLKGGTSTVITLNVTDAPAGLASATVTDVDEFGVSVGGSVSVITDINGLTKGEVEIEYTAPEGFSGTVTLSAFVSDGQTDEDGEDASKSSVARTVDIEVLCGDLAGSHTVDGEILVDDFGSGPYTFMDNISLADCEEEGAYNISDISGGLYANAYADNYGTSARAALIVINSTTNVVTWSGVSDQFGGQFVQDPAQPDSNYDAGAGTITIYWTATAFGERGITTINVN